MADQPIDVHAALPHYNGPVDFILLAVDGDFCMYVDAAKDQTQAESKRERLTADFGKINIVPARGGRWFRLSDLTKHREDVKRLTVKHHTALPSADVPSSTQRASTQVPPTAQAQTPSIQPAPPSLIQVPPTQPTPPSIPPTQVPSAVQVPPIQSIQVPSIAEARPPAQVPTSQPIQAPPITQTQVPVPQAQPIQPIIVPSILQAPAAQPIQPIQVPPIQQTQPVVQVPPIQQTQPPLVQTSSVPPPLPTAKSIVPSNIPNGGPAQPLPFYMQQAKQS